MLSLRGKVFTGAVFWSLGLGFAGVLFTGWALRQIPGSAIVIHGTFSAHAVLVIGLALACLGLGILSVQRGLAPLGTLRARLADVAAGREQRLTGRYPSEVQPLIDEINALLDERERRVERARSRAADLAHGLKTPLAVLAHEAERPSVQDVDAWRATLGQQVGRMQRQIDRHLAQARAAASGATPGARATAAEAVDALVRTMHRLHAGRGLSVATRVPDALAVRVSVEDLEEMVGNVIDNACKWARSRVEVSATLTDGRIRLAVDDDGAGLDPALWDAVLQRGVRADEAAPGTGLGLAITREIAEAYGGGVTLGTSPIGGLRVILDLPPA
jgi:signal transduction histidine kinase